MENSCDSTDPVLSDDILDIFEVGKLRFRVAMLYQPISLNNVIIEF
jgi:hypothetical protein